VTGETAQGPAGEQRRWIGRSVSRVEDRRHLTGGGSFVDDLAPPGLRYLAFARSPYAAARIEGIDVDEARSTPGVDAVLTAADLGELERFIPLLNRPDFVPVETPLLARDQVRHVGEPVAMVVAQTPHAAEDGAERVRVAYQPRDPVTSIDAAMSEGTAPVHEHASDNLLLDALFKDDPEIDGVIDRADLVIEGTFESARVTALPMEARACLAEWHGHTQRCTLHTSTQVPHIVRTSVAGLLALPEHRLRVIAPDVGGAFGQKCVVAREEVLTCIASRAVGQPVKWTADRQENLISDFQGHEQRYEVRAGFTDDGTMLALDARIFTDVGAYSCHPFTCGVEPLMAATEMLGPYTVRHYRCRTRAVATNKAPMAPYRGVARPQIVLVMERLMQKAARRLGLEQSEVRARNLIPDHAFPYTAASGLRIDKGSYRESLARCVDALDLRAFRERQQAAREEGRLIGLGLSCFGERTGYGTEAFEQRKMAMTPGYDIAHLTLDPTGGLTLSVGTAAHGQGHETTLAQIAAEALAVDPATIDVRQGDTDQSPYGWGTFASRSMVVSGGATRQASLLLAERLKRLGSHLLEAAPEDLELRDRAVVVRGSPESSVSFKDIGRIAYLEIHRLPKGEEPGVEARAVFDPPGTFSNATHGCIVEIDPDTGAVRIDRYVVVEDCGVMINPMIVEGQVRGGVAQGIAAALYEQLVYTDDGQPQTTSLMDYLVPTAAEIPPVEILHLETPSEHSVTGAKGMGEGGTMGAPACVASAVNDALAHLGIELDSLPITPEQVLVALERARTEGRPT
jgi:carbon-monoxide dehydrogenase large subunit